MKKVAALGVTGMMIFGMAAGVCLEAAPAGAVSAGESVGAEGAAGEPGAALVSARTLGGDQEKIVTGASSLGEAQEKLAAAIERAEEAIAATASTNLATGTAVAKAAEVAAMRTYLEGWVAQARRVEMARLSAAEQKELIAALEEGARGLRLMAGVDRKAGATASDKGVYEGALAEPQTIERTTAMTKKKQTSAAVKVEKVATATKVETKAEVKAIEGASERANAPEASAWTAAEGLVTLATAQVKKPVKAAAEETNATADVPKTGASEEEASTAVRGMGLILGGAVVLAAAAGAVLIVKRMKRGL